MNMQLYDVRVHEDKQLDSDLQEQLMTKAMSYAPDTVTTEDMGILKSKRAVPQTKIGYKCTDVNMVCRKFQYEIGTKYCKPDKIDPQVCSADGYHFANTLEGLMNRHTYVDGRRYFEVEGSGQMTTTGYETVATRIRFIREISRQEIEAVTIPKHLNLEMVKQIQRKFPQIHVAGSVALYLHGVRLKRWMKSTGSSDIDIVAPYFQQYKLDEPGLNIEEGGKKNSGNDFHQSYFVTATTSDVIVDLDVRIDPHEPYEIITHDGFDFKVSPVEYILAAKLKYAQQKGGQKHMADIYEMLGKNVK